MTNLMKLTTNLSYLVNQVLGKKHFTHQSAFRYASSIHITNHNQRIHTIKLFHTTYYLRSYDGTKYCIFLI